MKNFLLRKAVFCIISFVTLLTASASTNAQSSDEIIKGSYFVAFGRFPNSGEVNYWRSNLGGRSMQQMVGLHRDFIKSNQNEREQTVRRSYMDAFGWQPSSDELRYWSGQNKTYGELMSNHVNNWLNIYPDKKEHVIKQSYYKVFGRTASPSEITYWMGQRTTTFVQLVAMHTTWKMKNQNNSKMTGVNPGINNGTISTAQFSAQAAAQVVAAGGGNVIAAGGGNVIAAGGGNAVSAGGAN